MSRQESHSPARRPQLDHRASSSQSFSRASPTAGHLSKSQKGSTTRLHKAHAVGHGGRHPHGRVPSYGKGLHKLSKLGPGEVGDGAGHTRQHTRSASHTPTGSPTSKHIKRNSSQITLPRTLSKVSVRKSASHVSVTKAGNQPKSEKAQTKNNLRKKGNDDAPVQGSAKFSIGDEQDEQDENEENWEEASSSQSPHTTRHSPVRRKIPRLEDPPSPDEPPPRSPSNLPHSPPASPPSRLSALADRTKENNSQKTSKYSRPLDGDEVSHRLLGRNKFRPEAKLSNISASVTPNGSSGSPAFGNNNDPHFGKEPSMPADGISRFIGGTGSNSGSATPGSVTHSQHALTHNQEKRHEPPGEELSKERSPYAKHEARRAQSAANLTTPGHHDSEPSTSDYPPAPEPENPSIKPRVTTYDSARGGPTQLKLDLQRLSTLHDTPPVSHPLLYQHGAIMGVQNLSASGSEMALRFARQYQQSGSGYRNARRFHSDLLVSHTLAKKSVDGKKKDELARGKGRAKGKGKERADGRKGSNVDTPAGSSGEANGSSGNARAGRGNVRFELGGEGEEEDINGDGEGVKGLLRRMWEQSVEEGVIGEY